MPYSKFKLLKVLSNGSFFLDKNCYVKNNIIQILKKDAKNFELNKKISSKIKSKNVHNRKIKYMTY